MKSGNVSLRRQFLSASAMCAAAIVAAVVALSGQDDPLVKTEPLAQVIQRTQSEKPGSPSGSRIC